MSAPYSWRRWTPPQQELVLRHRQLRNQPWHSPPHWKENHGHRFFLISGACWEHRPHIGYSLERLDSFTADLLTLLKNECVSVPAWCILPNHYHALVETEQLAALLKCLGLFHGRTSFVWNREEGTRGRSNFYRCVDRAMRSEKHQWVTVNYIHHNPVHHGYTTQWQDWPWSSAHDWLEHHGREHMTRLWRDHPLLDYGRGWDDPES